MRVAVLALALGCAPAAAPTPHEQIDVAELRQRIGVIEVRLEQVERQQRALLADMLKRAPAGRHAVVVSR